MIPATLTKRKFFETLREERQIKENQTIVSAVISAVPKGGLGGSSHHLNSEAEPNSEIRGK
jgi:hypothetical protein